MAGPLPRAVLLTAAAGTQDRASSVFAAGLLPEGQHRQALAQQLGVAVNDIHSLLKRFGRDVAGALIIAAQEPPARPGTVIPYDVDTLEQEVLGLPERPLAIHDDSELLDRRPAGQAAAGTAATRRVGAPGERLPLEPYPEGRRPCAAGPRGRGGAVPQARRHRRPHQHSS